jgi:hypothetical protein
LTFSGEKGFQIISCCINTGSLDLESLRAFFVWMSQLGLGIIKQAHLLFPVQSLKNDRICTTNATGKTTKILVVCTSAGPKQRGIKNFREGNN